MNELLKKNLHNLTIMFTKDKETGIYKYNSNGGLLHDTISDTYSYVSNNNESYDANEFDIFKGDPKFMVIEGTRLELIKTGTEEKDNALFFVDNQFIEDVCIIEKLTIEETKKYLIECAKDTTIETDGKIYISFKDDNYSTDDSISTDNIIKSIGLNNNPGGFILVLNTLLSNDQKQMLAEYCNNQKKKSIKKIDVEKVIEEICSKIVGQEETIKTLVTNIYINQLLIDSLSIANKEIIANELDSRKQSILIDGSTGTGKTAILKEISKKLEIPLVIANANSFSETGYVGPSITDLLEKLLEQANGNISLAERGIVVLDEIDKIAETDLESRSMKLGVQKELLGFISGATYELKSDSKIMNDSIEFDTSKLTFILSGAFTSIKENKIKENNKNKFGFGSSEEKDNTYKVDVQDYIDYGLMREFFGRIKVLTYTKTYSKEDLKNILLNSSISPLKGLEKTCIMFEYPGIEYDDEFIDYICDKAYDMKTGARGLQTLISGIQDLLLMDLIYGSFDKNNKIKLSIDMIDEYNKRNERTY